MKFSAPAGIAVFLLVWSFCPQVAIAGDAAPKATATRPAQEPAGQSSLPNAAPPATTTQPTGSTNQAPQIKQMNEEGKRLRKRANSSNRMRVSALPWTGGAPLPRWSDLPTSGREITNRRYRALDLVHLWTDTKLSGTLAWVCSGD